MQELEDRAHAHRVLLSSDAMRHFIEACKRGINRLAYLEKVLDEAKVNYPTEDGWVVLNLTRMQELCRHSHEELAASSPVAIDKIAAAQQDKAAASITGSLAEAIVTGNIAVAYQLIGHRPMISLAEAASELDALYRRKQGETPVVSALLEAESELVSADAIKGAIDALTSALDGTYDSEAEAVKVAIMKAVKAVS